MTITTVASPTDIATVAQLAHEIWNEHYVPIIGQAQVDYMVDKFQSAPAIAAQIAGDYEYFLLHDGTRPAGYFAIQPEPAAQRLFLSKLYVSHRARGKGLGAAAIAYIDQECLRRGLPRICLTVNKANPAIAVYERLGFRIVDTVVTDIGAGFVMDDYRMEKTVKP